MWFLEERYLPTKNCRFASYLITVFEIFTEFLGSRNSTARAFILFGYVKALLQLNFLMELGVNMVQWNLSDIRN